jgi:hypothetical protein
MEHIPSSEATSPSSGQQIPRLLWSPKVQYHILRRQRYLSHDPHEFFYTLIHSSFRIYFNTILPSNRMYARILS